MPVVRRRRSGTTTSTLPKESEVLRDCLQYLNSLPGCWAFRQNSGAFAGEYRGKKRFIRFGMPGISDIIGIYKGRFLAVETKRLGNKPTEQQEAFLAQVKKMGGISVWVSSLEQLIIFMEKQ